MSSSQIARSQWLEKGGAEDLLVEVLLILDQVEVELTKWAAAFAKEAVASLA